MRQLLVICVCCVATGLAGGCGSPMVCLRDQQPIAEKSATPEAILSETTAHDYARVKRLLDVRPDLINARDEEGYTPLLRTCVCGPLARSASPREWLARAIAGSTNLSSDAVSEMYAKAGSGGFYIDGEANRLLECAHVAELLLDRGASVDARTRTDGFSALHLIVLSAAGIEDVHNKVNLYAVELSGQRILYTLRGAHSYLLRFVLSSRPDVDAKDNSGSTPLHWAAYYGLRYLEDLLIEAGADTTVENNQGNSPADIARERKAANLSIPLDP